MAQLFHDLDRALEAESWDWMEANQPALAEAVLKSVGRGAEPDAIKRRIVQKTGRWELAQRCELAAAYLKAAGDEGG